MRDVRPILQTNCYQCHGPNKQKALLRLDSRESVILNGGESGPEIVPGKSASSRLIHRVMGLDGDDRMPLNSTPLSDHDIAILKAWIDQGAHWPDSASVANAKIDRHWSYVKPVRPALPAVRDSGWCRNPIDRFVLAQLEKQGMHPSPEADRATLIRRVSLDLTGLPPTLREVDDFLNDHSPDAYAKVVDRLLASPHYGERAAMRWLDLARYADSNGYEKDRRRSMWPYRDWVINAMNADMPFDEFTIEQLAGDLLPHPTLQQRIATGFNRNTMLNEEGGVDEHEYYYYAVIDRVNTTATVWLGTTLNCCQCHNHKYDPFTQKDYYSFLAYFNSTQDETSKHGGTDPSDISARVTVDPPELIALHRKETSLQAELDRQTPQLDAAMEKWERSARLDVWKPLAEVHAESKEGATLTLQPDGSILAGGQRPQTDTYTVSGTTDLRTITGLRLEALADDHLPHRGPGRANDGNFVVTGISVKAAGADGTETPVDLTRATADFSQVKYSAANLVSSKQDGKFGWAVAPKVGADHTCVFELARPIERDGSTRLTITLQQLRPGTDRHTLGRFRLSVTSSPRPADASMPPDRIVALLLTPADQRDEAAQAELAKYYRSIAPSLDPVRSRLAEVRREIDAFPKTSLVMVELPQPRQSYIHVRGGYLTLGERVLPATPAVFGTNSLAPKHRYPNRLDLARWIVSDDNPLTARVAVNRIWEQYFGRGIVATSEDFGTQGEPPTNQPLLDWLACEFMHPSNGAHPWSMKAIHRLIVMSATYRQSSDVTPEMIEADPYDRMLERGPRFRLPAELIRDQALAVSGLLSLKMGGPSVFPLQPAGIWHSPYSGDTWVTSPGADRYRRGIYTFLRRSAPYPEFTAFDMTTHEAICTRRSRTDTPLQALTTLNDPAFLQPAVALGRRILHEGGDTTESRAMFAFRTVLIRKPDAQEAARLRALHDDMLRRYQADPKAAAALIADGPAASPGADSPAELAAWTMVSNVLLNLDETLTKE